LNSNGLQLSSDSTYVFGYGSLMNPEHPRGLSKTIAGHNLSYEHLLVAELQGFRRRWSALSAGGPGSATTYRAHWNLEKREAAKVTGVLVLVSEEELLALDMRERNYDRVEVTDDVTILGDGRNGPQNVPVYTYVSFPPISEVEYAIATGIDAEYERVVLEAASRIGHGLEAQIHSATVETRGWPRLSPA
jgi:cation transport regulator ChaC